MINLFVILIGILISVVYFYNPNSSDKLGKGAEDMAQLIEFQDGRKVNVMFVTAHPDDECMFFAPTIQNIPKNSDVYLLCLTNGNFYRMGSIREKELLESSKILGIKKENVFIHDEINLKDGPSEVWDEAAISKVIKRYVDQHSINVLMTFDEHGVSGHSNHVSIYHGMRHLHLTYGLSKNLRIYKLTSVNVVRKYASFIDIVITLVTSSGVFISSPSQFLVALRAMLAHKSQLEWFRYLYIAFSRYMLINDYLPM